MVAFLDADDYWASDCLEKLHASLVGNGVQLAYCGWQNLGVPGGRGEPFIPPDYSKGDKVEARRWSLEDLDIKAGYKAALAVEGDNWRRQSWQWQPFPQTLTFTKEITISS